MVKKKVGRPKKKVVGRGKVKNIAKKVGLASIPLLLGALGAYGKYKDNQYNKQMSSFSGMSGLSSRPTSGAYQPMAPW